MSEFPIGLVITRAYGASAADDGAALYVMADTKDGAEVVLSIAYDQLLTLTTLIIQGRSDCKTRKGLKLDDDTNSIPTTGYELTWGTSPKRLLMSMKLPNGGKLSFILSETAASEIKDALTSMIANEADI